MFNQAHHKEYQFIYPNTNPAQRFFKYISEKLNIKILYNQSGFFTFAAFNSPATTS